MKRSKALKLSLMGASALTLVACDNSQEVGVFETIDQCMDKAGFTRDVCEANQKVAQSEHIKVSPKYTSLSDCETDFGSEKCEVAPQRTTSGGYSRTFWEILGRFGVPETSQKRKTRNLKNQ